jgi:hypothetical protein
MRALRVDPSVRESPLVTALAQAGPRWIERIHAPIDESDSSMAEPDSPYLEGGDAVD